MSAAEALPPVSPWRDTSHILDRIPTDADLAAAPPPNEAGRAIHDANVAKLVTQAAWRPAPAPGVEPFTEADLEADRYDELEGIWTAMVEHRHHISNHAAIAALGAEYRRVERLLNVESAPMRSETLSTLPRRTSGSSPVLDDQTIPKCVRGLHPLTEKNTIKTPIPGLKCRACRRMPLPPAPQSWPASEPPEWN